MAAESYQDAVSGLLIPSRWPKLLNVAERALKLLQLLRKIMALLLWVMTRSLEHLTWLDICVCVCTQCIQEHKYLKPKLIIFCYWPMCDLCCTEAALFTMVSGDIGLCCWYETPLHQHCDQSIISHCGSRFLKKKNLGNPWEFYQRWPLDCRQIFGKQWKHNFTNASSIMKQICTHKGEG